MSGDQLNFGCHGILSRHTSVMRRHSQGDSQGGAHDPTSLARTNSHLRPLSVSRHVIVNQRKRGPAIPSRGSRRITKTQWRCSRCGFSPFRSSSKERALSLPAWLPARYMKYQKPRRLIDPADLSEPLMLETVAGVFTLVFVFYVTHYATFLSVTCFNSKIFYVLIMKWRPVSRAGQSQPIILGRMVTIAGKTEMMTPPRSRSIKNGKAALATRRLSIPVSP